MLLQVRDVEARDGDGCLRRAARPGRLCLLLSASETCSSGVGYPWDAAQLWVLCGRAPAVLSQCLTVGMATFAVQLWMGAGVSIMIVLATRQKRVKRFLMCLLTGARLITLDVSHPASHPLPDPLCYHPAVYETSVARGCSWSELFCARRQHGVPEPCLRLTFPATGLRRPRGCVLRTPAPHWTVRCAAGRRTCQRR